MTEPTNAQLAETLSELRGLLEAAHQHNHDMANRFTELATQVSDLWKANHTLERSLGMLRQRVDELRPQRLNCPHCGAAVQAGWSHCRMCTKAL